VNAAFDCGEHRLTYSQRAKTLGQKMVRAASAPVDDDLRSGHERCIVARQKERPIRQPARVEAL